MAASSSSSSSVVPRRRKGWTYDVFLSFRGEDTRNNFVDNLFSALTLKGIHTFKDDEMLGGGQPISQELVKAIKESRFAVVVFSKNYATTSWCLEELSNIMECHKQMGQKVLPVFYHVDPSDVRKQNEDFATAFETHEEKFKGGEMDKVNKWREALTAAASLSGQLILPDHGGEAAFISKIVEEILADIQPRGGSRENHLIGIGPCIDALISLLKMEETEEVRIVGICGMGGIGKTTIARALFKRIAHKFQGSSFVADVRENSSTKEDMCTLQERILKDILGEHHGYKIEDPDWGAEIIEERCCRKKVLLVLDDVSNVEQLEFLAATREWFGPGSRIVITTRDRHLLSFTDEKYEPATLSGDQAMELFSRNAFHKSSPPEEYEELSIRAINYAAGLPLTLKILGSFFHGQKANEWESALDRLATPPSGLISHILKSSFHDLNELEKQIFLDIACFYKGRDVDDVTRILDSFGFEPVIGIPVLVEKSLITISSYNRLDMHDLIQEMGRKVVQESAPNSRLWELEKSDDLIGKKRNWELEVIEGIVLAGEESKMSLSADVFKSMKNLRLLDCYQNFTSCEPTFLPDKLRWFCWREYPFSSLPVAHMSKLVGLEMERGKIKYLWKGEKIMLQNLKFINLQLCESLRRFPDVSGAPNIESLDLFGCTNLLEVDESVGSLKKLLYLDMTGCVKLKCLPSMLRMESLETLILSFCGSLKRIPEFSPCMVNLSKIDISHCSEIEEVPSSIKYLSNLSNLNLQYCRSLKSIPNSIWELKCLNAFGLSSCKKLQKSPDDFQSMESLLPRKGRTYDVFLSFRGEDTRNNFVDHLYETLTLKGIHTFKDDNMLRGGQPISEELVKAIKESSFAVLVFSKNYANSSWCLEELSKMMEFQNEMRQKVLPVFYHVRPSDVRKQNGDFATAFETHEDKFKGEVDKVNKWREALTAAANLSGYHISPHYGDESKFISQIVQQIMADIQSRGDSRENHLIGMEPRIDALISLLKMEATEEVRIVGIWGMGGIGKTAIARALFNRIAFKFEGSCFVTSVRENSTCKKDICALQQMILKDILGAFYGFKIHDPEDGGVVIQRICCSKKVLLVLDDVNDVKQLEFLAATREWFGPGSRIIITTRDQSLISYANANDMYRPALLRTDQALELFCRHAFHKSNPPEGYEELSIRAIRYSRGLPLALKVLGSSLSGKEASVWKSALDRLVETQIREVFETLKLSFDGLEFEEKELFLNIACFFRGEDIERVTRIHDCFGFHPIIGIRILIEKSLIIISDNKLDMHDLIQEMGWNIVDECAPNSRLWKVEKAHHFIKNRELEGVKAIVLPNKQYSAHQKLLHFSADVFERLKTLQLLDVSRKFTSCKPTILPRGLRWFSWNQYPFSSLPLADKCKLVGIEMHGGNIEHLWTGRKIMCNLKYLHLQRLDYLTRFPDVSEAPFIERLVLTYCRNLVEVHESLGYHKRLIYVNVSDCRKLNSFPSRIGMDSLETLIISRCSSLERFPEVTIPTVRLSSICLDGCSRIKELPSSIGYLRSLSCLNLARCMSLKNIPNSICELKSLTSLHLDDCVELLTLPEEFGSIDKLEELWLGFTDSFRALQRLPQTINFRSLKNMCSLRKLDLSWRQTEDKGFPEDLHAYSSLEELNLSGNFKLTELPASIYHLSNLKHLELNDCYKLQNLHSLPSGLQVLRASGCSSLEMIEDLPEKYEWLYKIWLVGCWKLPDQEDETNPSKLLLLSFLKKCAAVGHRLSIAIPGNKIPSWFKQQRGCDIPIELPPRWHSRVMGFAVSCVFNRMWKNGGDYPVIKFRVVNYGEFVPVSDISSPVSQSQILFADGKKTSISKPQNQMKPHFSEVDYINDTSSAADIDTVWIGYVPFGSFEHMCDDWSGMEGNLAISIKLKTGQLPVRCGAHIVYKEDLESMQQTNSCIADYSKLECVRRVGQSYIYEDKF